MPFGSSQLSPIAQTVQVSLSGGTDNCDHSFNQHPGRDTGEGALPSHRKGAHPGTIVNRGLPRFTLGVVDKR